MTKLNSYIYFLFKVYINYQIFELSAKYITSSVNKIIVKKRILIHFGGDFKDSVLFLLCFEMKYFHKYNRKNYYYIRESNSFQILRFKCEMNKHLK